MENDSFFELLQTHSRLQREIAEQEHRQRIDFLESLKHKTVIEMFETALELLYDIREDLRSVRANQK